MHLFCPKCGASASILHDATASAVVCPNCQSRFSIKQKPPPANTGPLPSWIDDSPFKDIDDPLPVEVTPLRQRRKSASDWFTNPFSAFALVVVAVLATLGIVAISDRPYRQSSPEPTPVRPNVPAVAPAAQKPPEIERFKSTTFAVYAESRIGDVVEIRGWATAHPPDNFYPSGAVYFVSYGVDIISCKIASGKERMLAFWPNPRQERIAVVRGRCIGVDSDGHIYLDRAEVLPAD